MGAFLSAPFCGLLGSQNGTCGHGQGQRRLDLESRDRWVNFSRARDDMFAHTHIPEAPWYTVEADDKRRARLNCIRHRLSTLPYEDMTPPAIKLRPRRSGGHYRRPPLNEQFFVPNAYP